MPYRVEDETPESYAGAPEGEAPELEPAEEDTAPVEGKHPCILTPICNNLHFIDAYV